jgi:murein tripeptide amidase MpaA
MPTVSFDRFYGYAELTSILEAWGREHTGLCRISSIGKSYEGRDIWLVTVTRFDTGPDHEKPALWLDANIHASEVTGCTAALHLIAKLLNGYERDQSVTRALDTRAFYIVPRLNPDGAELALAERPRFVRSSVRPYPFDFRQEGLHEEDVDGDGRVLMMRILDPNGAWKPHSGDARLMVRREPAETSEDASFYRVLPEGILEDYDGVAIRVSQAFEGLDLNRNFPMEWATESEQEGAGPYPTSEPEVRAMVDAVVARPNITAHITYHTFSGVHLRPYSSHPDEHFPTEDLRAYKISGERATEITGYPSASVFHDFRYDPKSTIRGGADDWSYEHLGVFSWTTEFWSPQRQAGLSDFHLIEWLRDHSVEDDLELLKWNDEALDGRGYVDWYPFQHPQLGEVELGGWDLFYCWANPPPKFLEAEIAPHSDLALWHLLISPRLEIESAEAEAVGDSTFRVRIVVANSGWLPTQVSHKALERKVCRPVEVEVRLPAGASAVGGKTKVEVGQLEGRVGQRSLLWWFQDEHSKDRAKAEWVVRAPDGGRLEIEARHARAGVARSAVELSAGHANRRQG